MGEGFTHSLNPVKRSGNDRYYQSITSLFSLIRIDVREPSIVDQGFYISGSTHRIGRGRLHNSPHIARSCLMFVIDIY